MIEVLDIANDTEAIIVRTNIKKLAAIIGKDLYVKSACAGRIATRIHELLLSRGCKISTSKRQTASIEARCPLELRYVLLSISDKEMAKYATTPEACRETSFGDSLGSRSIV